MARILNDWLDTYRKYQENTEIPAIYNKWVGISTIAAVLQRKVYTVWDKKIFPNLYIVLVGNPSARKGTAMEEPLYMLNELDVPLSPDAVTMQALIRRIISSVTSYKDPKDPNNVTHWQSALTIFSPELAVLIKATDSTLISALTDWYDCKHPWKYETIARKEELINNMYVNLLGATTPLLIPTIFPQETIGGGLTSRIVFVYARGTGKVVVFPKRSAEELVLRDKLIEDLRQMYNMVGQFVETEDYRNVYETWYMDARANPPFEEDSHFGHYLGRRSLILRKVAMVMCASRTEDMIITGKDLERGIEWLHEAEMYMGDVYASHGRLDEAEIITRIQAVIASKKSIRLWELYKMFLKDVKQSDFVLILDSLERTKFCYRKVEGTAVTIHYNDTFKKPPDHLKEMKL